MCLICTTDAVFERRPRSHLRSALLLLLCRLVTIYYVLHIFSDAVLRKAAFTVLGLLAFMQNVIKVIFACVECY